MAGIPYYDTKGLSRASAMDSLARVRATKRGAHEGGDAFVVPNNGGWALLTPAKGEPVRLRMFKGECPCKK